MNYKIDRSAPEPAYLQLYKMLVRDIVSGVYPYGSRLPSKRTISEETGVSVITAEHAITILNEEGYVECRMRSGTFVTYRGEDFPGPVPGSAQGSVPASVSGALPEALPGTLPEPVHGTILQKETAVPETAEHTRNTGDFPFSLLAKTLRKVLLDYGDRIMVKSPNHGCPELREEICRYLARSRGISVSPSQVIIGSGAEYLYGLIVQMFGTDRIYALERPSYNKIRKVYEAMGADCDMLAMTREGIARRELERTKATILHVTPFNSFPTGITAGISKKREYLKWAKTRGGIVIEDNYDSELTVSRKPEDPLFSMDPDENVIYLNTFSGTIVPSIRIGYMLLPVRLTELFNSKLGFYSCTVPILEQYFLTELLKSGDFERHINRLRRKKRRDGK